VLERRIYPGWEAVGTRPCRRRSKFCAPPTRVIPQVLVVAGCKAQRSVVSASLRSSEPIHAAIHRHRVVPLQFHFLRNLCNRVRSPPPMIRPALTRSLLFPALPPFSFGIWDSKYSFMCSLELLVWHGWV
jgi:hypothetical protein